MTAFDAYEPVTLHTSALVLEPLLAAHAAEVIGLLSDPAHYVFLPQDPPESLEALRHRYARWESRKSPDGRELWLNWLIRRAGTAVGLVQATCRADKRAIVAYELFAPFRGQGTASEAVRAMLEHLRTALEVETAAALVDTRNVSSIRLLERLGFERKRLIANADVFKGATSDEYLYELDLRSWPCS